MTRAIANPYAGDDIRNGYRHKILNLTEWYQPFAIDYTARKASSFTGYVYNDISGGTHIFTGTNNSTVELDAPTPGSSRAICNLSFVTLANTSYVVSFEVVSATNTSGILTNLRQFLVGISGYTGDILVDIPEGATGRWGYRFTTGAAQSGLTFRFGAGCNAAIQTSSANIIITKPMIQIVTDLTVPFMDYQDLPTPVLQQGGYQFSSGNSGQIVATTDYEVVATESNLFDFGLGVGDSFANDSSDWPQALQINNFQGVFHGKGYSGQLLTGTIGSEFAANLAAYDYTFAVIQGGVNDINNGKTLVQIQTAIQAMVADAGTKAKIILGIAPWSAAASWSSVEQTLTENYNAWLKTYCADIGAIYVDIYTLLDTPNNTGKLLAVYDSGDGLHPNAIGMRLIADEINRLITNYRVI